MTSVEALRIAATKEKTAVQFYSNMVSRYPEIKELLLFLMNEEEKHCQLIEKKIADIMR